MKENIEKLLYEKYLKEEVPQNIQNGIVGLLGKIEEYDNKQSKFKYSKVTNNKSRISKIAAVFVICIISISLSLLYVYKNYDNSENIIAQVVDKNEDKKDLNYENIRDLENIVYETIKIEEPKSASYDSFASKKNVEYVAIIKVDEILGTVNYSLKNKCYTYTKIKAKVIKCLKGSLNENIEFLKSGGIISIKDYENIISKEQIQKYGYDKKSEEEKENSYVKITSSLELSYAEVLANKTYLVSLKYDKILYDMFVLIGEFSIREYDESTNSIKNESTGKFEKIEDIETLNDILNNN